MKVHELRRAPHRPAVVGRAEGRCPEYLDPSYRPTTLVPGTAQSVLLSGGAGSDHFEDGPNKKPPARSPAVTRARKFGQESYRRL